MGVMHDLRVALSRAPHGSKPDTLRMSYGAHGEQLFKVQTDAGEKTATVAAGASHAAILARIIAELTKE